MILTLGESQAGVSTSEFIEKGTTTNTRCRKTRTCVVMPHKKHNTDQQVCSMDFLPSEVRVRSNFPEPNDMDSVEVLQSKRRVAMISRQISGSAALQ